MKNSNNTSSVVNMIGNGTVITGDIQSKSDIRIDGILKGSVKTEGKLVVGSTGVVEGDVVCVSADVSGEIKAKITVSQLLSLKSTSKLNGDIITNKLSIEPGASFSGSCSMGAVIKDIKHVEKQDKKEKTA
ncbi:MAG: bactofilin family protein [Flavobacteriales bacterium]